MNIGILGSGIVGQTLAAGFIKHGYSVMIGTRENGRLDEWKSKNEKVRVGTFAETANFGEIIVLAIKGRFAESALRLAGKENIGGKIIIDTTNPIADAPPTNGVLTFFTSLDKSLMETLQTSFPEARFVKAFSCIGAACMVNPSFPQRPSMFICGNDEHAKKEVSTILALFGFEVEDLGKVEAARAVEPLCMLWCIPGFLKNDWYHGLRMMRK